MARLTINGKTLDFNVDPSTPLLWAIREQAGLTGTKYGCGIAQCGACTVHLDGAATRSCVLPVAAAEGPGPVRVRVHRGVSEIVLQPGVLIRQVAEPLKHT